MSATAEGAKQDIYSGLFSPLNGKVTATRREVRKEALNEMLKSPSEKKNNNKHSNFRLGSQNQTFRNGTSNATIGQGQSIQKLLGPVAINKLTSPKISTPVQLTPSIVDQAIQQNSSVLQMHIDRVKNLWVQKQLHKQQDPLLNGGPRNNTLKISQQPQNVMKHRTQRQSNERKVQIGKGSWHLVEGLDGQQQKKIGEYISQEGRKNQVKYFKSAHFKLGFETGFKDKTTNDDTQEWLKKLQPNSLGGTFSEERANNGHIVSPNSNKRTHSSIKLGNKMEFNQVLNRTDTSSGSTYSPKMIEGERTNLKKITEGMRKTNFHLGFKKQDAPQPASTAPITRNITIISEEDEPPASFHKASKMETKKDQKSSTQRRNSNAFVIKKNVQIHRLTLKQPTDHIHLGTVSKHNVNLTQTQDIFKSPQQDFSKINQAMKEGSKQMSELQRRTNFSMGYDQHSQTNKKTGVVASTTSQNMVQTAIEMWRKSQKEGDAQYQKQVEDIKHKTNIKYNENKALEKLPLELQKQRLKDHFKSVSRDTYQNRNHKTIEQLDSKSIDKSFTSLQNTLIDDEVTRKLREISKKLPNLMNFSSKLKILTSCSTQGPRRDLLPHQEVSIKMSMPMGVSAQQFKSHSHDIHTIQVHDLERNKPKLLTSITPQDRNLNHSHMTVQGSKMDLAQKYKIPIDKQIINFDNLSSNMRRLQTPQFSQFRLGPSSVKSARQLIDRQRSETASKSAYEDCRDNQAKVYYAYDHERDHQKFDEVRQQYREIKHQYTEAHFKLGEERTSKSRQHISESKQQYGSSYDPDDYRYQPRCQTNSNLPQRYNYFQNVPLAGQDNSYYSTVNQKFDQESKTALLKQNSVQMKRCDTENSNDGGMFSPLRTNLDQSLMEKSVTKQTAANQNLSSFKLGFVPGEINSKKEFALTANNTSNHWKIYQDAKEQYKMNNLSTTKDNVANAIHSAIDRPRTSSSQTGFALITTNKEYHRWIQPVNEQNFNKTNSNNNSQLKFQ